MIRILFESIPTGVVTSSYQYLGISSAKLEVQGVKKVPGSPPILRFISCEDTISHLFHNQLSTILNNPYKRAHLVVEDAL